MQFKPSANKSNIFLFSFFHKKAYNICMKNKENYQNRLYDTLNLIRASGTRPRLLLHVCCAPCSSACLDILKDYFDITLLFYNPNIHPHQEYIKRDEELKQFVKTLNQENAQKIEQNLVSEIKIWDIPYNADEFFMAVKGLEKEREGGARCKKCFKLRLAKTAEICKMGGFDYFTTTLTISPYKDSSLLNEIGKAMQSYYNTKYLFSDFKKDNGYNRSLIYSNKYRLYRQDYCGCVFSKLEREKQKKAKAEKLELEKKFAR